MTTFVTNDGEKFEAANSKDLVKQMARSSFGETDSSLHQYMQEVASRSQCAASVTLRSDNCDNFVADMLMHNLLKVEE